MTSETLARLHRELLSLKKKQHLSTREKKRLQTVLRQIPIEQQRLAIRIDRREQKSAETAERKERTERSRIERLKKNAEDRDFRREEKQQKLIVARQERRQRKAAERQWKEDLVQQYCEEVRQQNVHLKLDEYLANEQVAPPIDFSRPCCRFCGRTMQKKHRFCNKKCRRAFHRLPSSDEVVAQCEEIRSHWSEHEEVKRSRHLGGGKWRAAAAAMIEQLGRQLPLLKVDEKGIHYHGSGTNRSDNDYWNQF